MFNCCISNNLGVLGAQKYLFLIKDFIYLFMGGGGRDRDIGRERSRLHAGNLMWDSILGCQDHALG